MRRFWITMIAIFLIDQFTKAKISSTMALGSSKALIPGFLDLSYIHNAGAAFGIMQGKAWISLIIGIIVIVAMIYINAEKMVTVPVQYASALIAGGSLGNLMDRWFYGYVIDFFSIGWWPVFNVADMAIVIGGALFIIYIFMNEKREDA